MTLGFHTGSLRKFVRPISKEAIEICRKIGCSAIELGGGSPERLKYLDSISQEDLKGFNHVSLHAPRIKDREDEGILKIIQRAHDRLNFNCVVIHPDTILDWAIFNDYNFNIAIENMDKDKIKGRCVEDLEVIFKSQDFKMVLDLNHCYTNDKSMKLGREFYEKFKDKICEIHISGYSEHEIHDALYKTKQVEILHAIPDKDLPLIIEVDFGNIEDVKAEYDYIKNYLQSKI